MMTNSPQPYPASYAPRRPMWPWIAGGAVVLGAVAGSIWYARRSQAQAVNGTASSNGAAKTPKSFVGQVSERVNMRVGEVHVVTLPLGLLGYWRVYQGWSSKTIAKENGAPVWIERTEHNGTIRLSIEAINPGHEDVAVDYYEGSATESGYSHMGKYVVPVTVTS